MRRITSLSPEPAVPLAENPAYVKWLAEQDAKAAAKPAKPDPFEGIGTGGWSKPAEPDTYDGQF
jgi:hypothetical protein